MDYKLLITDEETAINYFQEQNLLFLRGCEAFFRRGIILWMRRYLPVHKGKWGEFLEKIGISEDQDRNYRKVSQKVMIQTEIIQDDVIPTPKDCIKALKETDENPALMQPLIQNLDMKVIWRQKKISTRRKMGSLIELGPRFSQLMGASKNRAQYCHQWDWSGLCGSLDLLDRWETEVGALKEHIVNKWLDEELKKRHRHVTLKDLELEPADMVD